MTNAAVAYVSRRFRRKNADTAFRTGWPPQTPFVDEPHRRMHRERHRQPPMSPAMRSLDRACGDRVMPRLPFRNPVAVRSKHSRIDAYLHHICCSHITAMDAPRLRRQSEARPQGAAPRRSRAMFNRRRASPWRSQATSPMSVAAPPHEDRRVERGQTPQTRSRQIPEHGARGLGRDPSAGSSNGIPFGASNYTNLT
jgi:hypothetical protein